MGSVDVLTIATVKPASQRLQVSRHAVLRMLAKQELQRADVDGRPAVVVDDRFLALEHRARRQRNEAAA